MSVFTACGRCAATQAALSARERLAPERDEPRDDDHQIDLARERLKHRQRLPPDSFGASTPPPTAAPSAYYHYFWWEAALVALDSVVGLIFAWTGVGALFWVLGLAYAAWRDWRGLVSLRGIIPWGRYSRIEQLILALILIVAAPLLFWVYSFQIVRDVFRAGGEPSGAGLFFTAQ